MIYGLETESNSMEEDSFEGFNFGDLDAELDLNNLEGEFDLSILEADVNGGKRRVNGQAAKRIAAAQTGRCFAPRTARQECRGVLDNV